MGGRRAGPPGSEGRWSLVRRPRATAPSETERRAALARALLDRHGIVTREAVHAEGIEGGFSAVYDVLKAMEETGRVRRGYFVEGLGATQFALPGADDRLRSLRDAPREPHVVVLAATDPANPYGAALAWPERAGAGDSARPQRAAGAHVILAGGELVAFTTRGEKALLTFLPEAGAPRERAAKLAADALAALVDGARRKTILIAEVDGAPAGDARSTHLEGDAAARRDAIHAALIAVGFSPTSQGYFKRPSGSRA